MKNNEQIPFILIPPEKADNIIENITSNVYKEQLEELDFEQIERSMKAFIQIFALKLFKQFIKIKAELHSIPKNIIIPAKEEKKKYTLTYKRKSKIKVNTIFGSIKIPTYYFYNQKYNHGITYNPVKYTENDFISPGLKRLISITSINFSDGQAVEYLYQLFNLNIGEKTLMNVRHTISAEAETWQNKNETIVTAQAI